MQSVEIDRGVEVKMECQAGISKRSGNEAESRAMSDVGCSAGIGSRAEVKWNGMLG